MAVIGISCFYHDSAVACIDRNGEIICAVQEERFSRLRHDKRFPIHSLNFCISEIAKLGEEIEAIVFYENSAIKFERLARSSIKTGASNRIEFNQIMGKWLGKHLYQVNELTEHINKLLPNFNIDERLFVMKHHDAHSASAFFPSPFEEAAILTLDGVGEISTASIGIGKNNKIQSIKEMHFPNSLGLLYSAFTFHTGFKVNSGEYKMMGLAPYGKPVYAERIKKIFVDIKDDGSFLVNNKYFDFFCKDTIINELFDEALGVPRRNESDVMSSVYADVAASIQNVIEEILVKIVNNIKKETGLDYLCFAGGVALNSVANGIIAKKCDLKGFWIQPAAGDAGGALGAAYYYHHQICNNSRKVTAHKDKMQGAYLGPEFTQVDIDRTLKAMGAKYSYIGMDSICNTVAQLLTCGNTIAWFQGRMEFGPRALGNRSIIADPRRSDMQKKLNLLVKKRESFRPFAPSILMEESQKWFELQCENPYMLFVSKVNNDKLTKNTHICKSEIFSKQEHSQIPAVTHIDNSARMQTVNSKTNTLYHELISSFYKLTGCPLIINTSFNVRGEPIVCSPEDAFKCFVNTELDYLAIGPYLVKLADQDQLVLWKLKQSFHAD